MLFDSYKFIDLSHLITSHLPSWDKTSGFSITNLSDYHSHGYRSQDMHLHADVGTHMDAPAHFCKGGKSIADMPIESLIVPACILNVSEKADANYLISTHDIAEYEKKHGLIPKNSFVIGYTGWSKHWPDTERYLNVDSENRRRFPSFSTDAVKLLLDREILGVGIDTLSPDCHPDFPVHKLLLENGKYIVENLANCHLMPAQGGYVILLPLNMDSTESPIRAVGLKKD